MIKPTTHPYIIDTFGIVKDTGTIMEPISDNKTNSFKSESTIPVKVRLDSNFGSDTTVQLFVAKLLSDGTFDTEVPAVSSSNANTSNLFRYDGKQYIFNLNTKNMVPGTYQLRVDLGDHLRNTVTITLK